jgi:hypothetical protein
VRTRKTECDRCKAPHGEWIAYDASGWFILADGGAVFDLEGKQHGFARGSEWPAVRDVIVHVRRDGLCKVCHAKGTVRTKRHRPSAKGQTRIAGFDVRTEGK